MSDSSEVMANKSDIRWASGGSHHNIVTVGNPVLRQRCISVNDINSICSHCDSMVTLLRELNGAGLAAPQVGLNERIIVVEVRKTDLFPNRPESPLYIMINPEIIEFSGEVEEGWEGCFSVPGLMGLVSRAKFVTVKYSTSDGIEKTEMFEGYVARVVQHEYDHLNGCIFLDRMESMKSISTVENYKRFRHGE
jgi:peptide deformylase